MVWPELAELAATVARMEQRLAAEPSMAMLWGHYLQLCPRFEADLSDERDRLLARSAALMLLQQALANPAQCQAGSQ